MQLQPANTGSDLIWTQCQPCQACYETKYALFDSRNSSTYRNITCSARECRLLGDARPPNYSPNICRKFPEGNCDYRVTYADKASSTGVLAKETITLTSKTGKVVTLKDIVFGCGFLNDAGPVGATGNQMGVIGLGKGPLSFVSQIAPHVGGKRFSYCLVPLDTDPSTKSQINFGNGSEVLGEGVVSTPLVDIEGESYVVAVEGITIGNEFVPFNSSKTLANKLNMIVDSGSTLGDVPRDIFDRVVTQLNMTLDPELEPRHIHHKLPHTNSSSWHELPSK
ncbi:aspartic proteinase CDR1-like [Rosa rugosa]|uniref:aspartic proteinase CDR1-like n=1 Tax=Rosa rugosa TaxID=74645 RepID=UPI002B40FAD7|nr:aspartic proteinase CDR1-like [Rosa rugosa]